MQQKATLRLPQLSRSLEKADDSLNFKKNLFWYQVFEMKVHVTLDINKT